jgi:hypothetical protein
MIAELWKKSNGWFEIFGQFLWGVQKFSVQKTSITMAVVNMVMSLEIKLLSGLHATRPHKEPSKLFVRQLV